MDEGHSPGAGSVSRHPARPSSPAASSSTQTTGTAVAQTLRSRRAASPGASSAETFAKPAHDASTVSKRKRGIGLVTPNACNECRKKRAKACGFLSLSSSINHTDHSQCANLSIAECVYEAPVRQSKEHLREELELLNRQKRSRDQILAALARPDHPDLREDVLARLQNGQSADSICESLAGVLPSLPTSAARQSYSSSNSRDEGSHAGTYVSASGNSSEHRNFVSSSHSPGVSPVSTRAPFSRLPGLGSHSAWGAPFPSRNLNSLAASGNHPDAMEWTAGSSGRQRVGSWLDNEGGGTEDQRFHGLDQVLTPEIPEMKVPAGAWTKVTDDSRLVQHLLALYFCWEYPTFASLSKELFLKDFQDGRTRYCSSMLVNALLALGCRFSSHPATRATPDDPHTSGDHFFRECVRQFAEEDDHYRMTTIQALGIMSIREASCGRDSESLYYAGQSMRLALEMGLQMNVSGGHNDDETEVRSATFWGAYSLDLAWCLATGSLPQCSRSPHLPSKPAIIDDIEASLWIPYTDNASILPNVAPHIVLVKSSVSDQFVSLGAPLSRSSEQPSNVRSVYKCFCELSELVHRSLYILHTPGRPVTSQKLQNIYTEYLSWYDRVPDVLRLGHNFTPSVLFAHMYYHFAILLLFRPFIKLRIRDSSLVPKDICLQAADAIQGLSGSYSRLYTLRRTPSFVPYFVLTSAIMHLTIGAESSTSPRSLGEPNQPPRINPELAQAISRGIADLTEMAPCHHFAEQALNILLHLAERWHLDIRVKESDDKETHLSDVLSLHSPSIRRRGVRPSADSLNLFVPEVTPQDVMCSWGLVAPDPGAGTEATRETRRPWEEPAQGSILYESDNPLFWPFPMQGRPLLPTGDRLREAGFEFCL
ncbi:hypothetical protein CONLIGDRAFT_574758 [Coniochaeta ligniaria NRRL 30616]|uniref:Xylanolytic transcriptional activator regulatory domain-containing protein n=1 Tax=Coniochaeta ligniaria NRRL 30616 TaxID=1408157 RepID=A0A1J7JB10_9PEZI|nr:hypothetical protein CONLIGDRAFT_574758 [Coniochaeta ligniaria NRRL 30616]